jgi:hypothetical protein
MRAWVRILDRFRASTAIPSTELPTGRRLSVVGEYIAAIRRFQKTHDPIKAAQRDAQQSDPSLRDDVRTAYEREALCACQDELDKLKRAAVVRMRQLDTQAREAVRTYPRHQRPDPRDIQFQVESRFASAFSEWRRDLRNSALAIYRNTVALKIFMRQNHLFRQPRRPNRWVGYFGIFAAAVLEAGFNFFYLLPTGVSGATEIIAFVSLAALLNVFLGVMAGIFGGRNLFHISARRRAFGVVVLLLISSFAVVLHAGLGNYRAAIDAASMSAMLDADMLQSLLAKAGRNLRADPFAFFDDIRAVLVFAGGLAFYVIAIFEAVFLIGDPYPGFSARDADYRRVCERGAKTEAEFRAAISGIVAEIDGGLQQAMSRGHVRLQAVKRSVDDAAHIARHFEQEASRLEEMLFGMFADYREEYRQVSGTPGPEEWADDFPRLDREFPFEMDHLQQIEEKEVEDFAALTDTVDEIRAHLVTEKEKLFAQAREYLDNVGKDAEREAMAEAAILGVNVPPPPAVPEPA